MTTHALAGLVAVLFLLAPVPPAKEEKRSIAFKTEHTYFGGLDRHWKVDIDGPDKKTWSYSFRISPSRVGGDVEAAGTCEIDGDLAVFTGTAKQKDGESDVRFALNFGFPGDKVQFHGFFPVSDRELRYHTRTYQRSGKEWKPAEEVVLAMPREVPAGDEWKVAFAGEWSRWDGDGKKTSDKIEKTVTYKKMTQGGAYVCRESSLRPIPVELHPRGDGKQLEACVLGPDNSLVGKLRGFTFPIGR